MPFVKSKTQYRENDRNKNSRYFIPETTRLAVQSDNGLEGQAEGTGHRGPRRGWREDTHASTSNEQDKEEQLKLTFAAMTVIHLL